MERSASFIAGDYPIAFSSTLPRRHLQLPEKKATVSFMSSFPRAATSLRTLPSATVLALGGLLLLRPARR